MDVVVWVVTLAISVVFAVICYRMAVKKGRNSTLWAVLGFFFPLISLIILLVLSDKSSTA